MILISYGTRPEYIKLKPIFIEFEKQNIKYSTLFTGQHKDLLKEHKPTISIDIRDGGNNRLNEIVSSILDANIFNRLSEQPTYVMVMGDTTSAMAVALSAFHNKIKIIHLEAGLRTYDNDNPYPEEVNRRIISHLANIHLCPTNQNLQNLKDDSIDTEHAYVVGNTVIDNLLEYKDKCEYGDTVLVTLHRRENQPIMDMWFKAVNELAENYPEIEFILPIHPNPNVIKHRDLLRNVTVIDPLPYDKLLDLLVKCRLVITDSGGLQEECSFLNKICLTCRVTTERPEAIGFSTIMIRYPGQLLKNFDYFMNNYETEHVCPFGDGHAAEKIANLFK